jgi:hypothetical protein
MTEYETIDLLLSASENFDSLFGYWISVTFAVVAATFVVRNELNVALALTIAATYLVATLLFLTRFATMASLLTNVMSQPTLPDEFHQSLEAQNPIRSAAFIVGFLMTEMYVFYTYFKQRGT